ncbi:carbon monoxide dehydrogenase [Variovorax sp. WS11]|uniref:SRPBCC family protein n=1 Tax=Variovorax sp. WS11 TaxID=1105204 RepID=UPI000D0DBA8C|nr:carbon monoxide dehydrogenase subunit G [Variovorax sp. WS11]NDZ17183.1 carbon monoxide dehydrogenase subunit G [Variovorax sp. WS11]PSL79109.1 carbon monoxide dehydrogenase [Variovorax sp. WS11]
MEITGTQTIAAPRQRVWEALNDPDILKRSLPGCESVERTSAEEFKVIVAAAIGPLRARFNGLLRMSDIRAPESCTMVFEGQGGAVGFGKGNSSVKLSESNGQTELTYTAQAQVGGKLAQVGSRLIDSVARKMADDFFKAFKTQLAGVPAVAKNAVAAPVAAVVKESASKPAADPTAGFSITPTPAAVAATQANAKTAPAVMVPGWWLAISAVIGSVATLAGVLFAR